MEVIILAGGFGTRLKHLLNNSPKALADINGHPFLDYLIGYLVQQGCDRFVFSLGYLREQIITYVEQKWPHLDYAFSIEENALGTGGAIKKAIDMLRDDSVLIVNADTFLDVDLKAMFDFHHLNKSDCTISVKEMTDFDRYGTVLFDSSMRIVNFQEKKQTEIGFINAGFIILNKNCIIEQKSLPEVFSFEKDFLEVNLEKFNIHAFISNTYFIDIGVPNDYNKAKVDFQKEAFTSLIPN